MIFFNLLYYIEQKYCGTIKKMCYVNYCLEELITCNNNTKIKSLFQEIMEVEPEFSGIDFGNVEDSCSENEYKYKHPNILNNRNYVGEDSMLTKFYGNSIFSINVEHNFDALDIYLYENFTTVKSLKDIYQLASSRMIYFCKCGSNFTLTLHTYKYYNKHKKKNNRLVGFIKIFGFNFSNI